MELVLAVVQWVKNLTAMLKGVGSIPGPVQWVKSIQCCRSCSLDSVPGLGTSICCGDGHKKNEKIVKIRSYSGYIYTLIYLKITYTEDYFLQEGTKYTEKDSAVQFHLFFVCLHFYSSFKQVC